MNTKKKKQSEKERVWMEVRKCEKCGYQWTERVKSPKSCPRCKTRLDYERKKKKEA